MFYLCHLIIRSYDYNMHVGDLLLPIFVLITLLMSEQCLQF